MKAVVIINPNSGPKSIELSLENSIEKIRKAGFEVEKLISRSTTDAKDFTTKAVKEKVDLVIAVGGDGTINEIAAHLVKTDIPLGIIPTGTANVFANELGIPTRKLLKWDYVLKATDVILEGQVKYVDLGKVIFENKLEKYFVMWCGIGLDAKLVAAKNTPPKKMIGRIINYLSWLLKVIKLSIAFSGSKTVIKLDKRTEEINLLQAIVSNGSLYANYFTVSKHAKLDDGLLDAYLLRNRGLIFRTKILIKSILSRKLFSELDTTQNKHISVKSETPLPVHVDAEAIGYTPVEIEIVPHALKVIAPKN